MAPNFSRLLAGDAESSFGERHACCFCRTRVFRWCCWTRYFCWVSRSHAAQAWLRESPTSHRYRRVYTQLPAKIASWFVAALRLSAAETPAT